jgi:hypothetical protein
MTVMGNREVTLESAFLRIGRIKKAGPEEGKSRLAIRTLLTRRHAKRVHARL